LEHSKATPKQQTVERQAIDEIFWSFGVILGKVSFLTKPTRRLTSQLARFLHARPVFILYITFLLQKLQKQKQKTNQTIERVGFGSFGVVFGVALE
jgi:hypothetical protein